MRARSALVALLLVAACASTPGPDGFLSSPGRTASRTQGGWIDVDYRHEGQNYVIAGELIAVGPDRVWVLTARGLAEVPLADVLAARLGAYEPEKGGLAVWTVIGMLTTASHGWFLILTAPLWAVTGSIATVVESFAGRLEYPKSPIESFRKWARFPQGMPPGVDEGDLRDASSRRAAPEPPATQPATQPASQPVDERGFRFSSGGAFHVSGYGEWSIAVTRGLAAITHNVHGAIETFGPYQLAPEDVAKLWQLAAEAQLETMASSTRAGVADEVAYTFTVGAKDAPPRTVTVWINDARADAKLMALVQWLAELIQKATGEHPVVT